MRHHSLFAPRDFDVSPYFQVIKPGIESGFDHHALHWDDAPLAEASTHRSHLPVNYQSTL